MGDKAYNADDIERLAGLITEKFEGQLANVVENIDSRIAHHIAPLQEDIATLKDDMAALKSATRETNRDIQILESRISRLEAA